MKKDLKKLMYVNPAMEVISFYEKDIITTSITGDEEEEEPSYTNNNGNNPGEWDMNK